MDAFLPWTDHDPMAIGRLLDAGTSELHADIATGDGTGDFAQPALRRVDFGHGWSSDTTLRLHAGDSRLGWEGEALGLRGEALFLQPELSTRIVADGELTLGLFGAFGSETLARAYDNAGRTDRSTGRAGTATYGGRLHLVWPEAATVGGLSLSPFADAEVRLSRRSAYDERGGAFPASFDGRGRQAARLRLGVDLATPLGASLDLVARAELLGQATRLGRSGGQIRGLSGFTVPQEERLDLAGRAMIGLRTRFEGGDLVLSGALTATRGGKTAFTIGLSLRRYL